MSKVRDTLVAEFTIKAKEAIRLKGLIESAKTDTKRNFYKKKLHKNNIDALQVLEALQKIVPSKPESTQENETVNVEQPTNIV